jgi:hypothetical protein
LLAESEGARLALAEMQVLRKALIPADGNVRAPSHLTDKIMRAVSDSTLTATSHAM